MSDEQGPSLNRWGEREQFDNPYVIMQSGDYVILVEGPVTWDEITEMTMAQTWNPSSRFGRIQYLAIYLKFMPGMDELDEPIPFVQEPTSGLINDEEQA